MGFDYLRPPIGETIFNSKGIINEVWNKFFTEIVGVEQFKYLEGIVAGNISVGDAIASLDYAAGTTGWRIATDAGVGVAEFNIPIVSYANISGTKPPVDADATATVISGGLVTTGRVEVVQGGTVSAGITGTTTGDTAVRFWAGSTYANRASAPFRVLQSGVVYMTGAIIDSTSTLNGTAASTVVSNASTGAAAATTVNGWKYAATTYIDGGDIYTGTITTDQIAANTITSGDIANATITATNIANGTVTATQIANGTITTTQIAANTIVAGNIAASTITGAKIAANTITAGNIVAGTITATEIAASTITSNKLSVSTLSAITADLGSITAGTLTGASSGSSWNLSTNILKFTSAGKIAFKADETNYIIGNDTTINVKAGSNGVSSHTSDGVSVYADQASSNILISTASGTVTLKATGSGTNVVLNCGAYSSDSAGIINFQSNGSQIMFAKANGLYPTSGNRYLGYYSANLWLQVHASAFYDDNVLLSDKLDDLYEMSLFTPRKIKTLNEETGLKADGEPYIDAKSGLEYIDLSVLPKHLTNYDTVFSDIKKGACGLLTDIEIEEAISDYEELGWMLNRNISAFNDLTSGAVRQLDIEVKEVFELLMGRITTVENKLKEITK